MRFHLRWLDPTQLATRRKSSQTCSLWLDFVSRSEVLITSRTPITNKACSVIGPQFFNKPPHYSKLWTPTSTLHNLFAHTLFAELGIGSCVFTFAGMIVTAVLFQIYIMRLNKKRAPMREQALAVLEGRLETGFEDLTDKENPLFIYVY